MAVAGRRLRAGRAETVNTLLLPFTAAWWLASTVGMVLTLPFTWAVGVIDHTIEALWAEQ